MDFLTSKLCKEHIPFSSSFKNCKVISSKLEPFIESLTVCISSNGGQGGKEGEAGRSVIVFSF